MNEGEAIRERLRRRRELWQAFKRGERPAQPTLSVRTDNSPAVTNPKPDFVPTGRFARQWWLDPDERNPDD